MNNLEHLDAVDFDLLEFGIISRMSGLCDRDLSPFFIGGYRNTLILECLELLIGSLGFETSFSLDQGRFY